MRALSRWFVLLFVLCSFTAYSQDLFNAAGKPLAKQAQRTREPKIVLDTLRLSGGFGVLRLNQAFKKGKHSVVASTVNNMKVQVTQVITDTTDAVNYYGVLKYIDSILIKSSQTDDSGLVEIRIDIR